MRSVLADPYAVTAITKFEHRPLLVYCLLSCQTDQRYLFIDVSSLPRVFACDQVYG